MTMTTKVLDSCKRRFNRLKTETYALYLACKDSRVSWYAKLILACIVAYPFSPIDKFLDSIPVIGYLDHLILVPIGVLLVFKKMIPRAVLADCQERAQMITAKDGAKSWGARLFIIGIWFLLISLAIFLLTKLIGDWNLIVAWWVRWFTRTAM